jgi:protein-tyrosine phosphatase
VWTKLNWIREKDLWVGKLALAARPRGGDWLEDELVNWKRAGIDCVLSLLTREEEEALGLGSEAEYTVKQGMRFVSFAIPDREVPASKEAVVSLICDLKVELGAGRNVVVHCRQGVGRTGLMAACLLVSMGMNPEDAMKSLSIARGIEVPETEGQRQWIGRYHLDDGKL